ncbi:MAG: hypothetical protein Q9225_003632 [Loekoesia sp. 1 TL-2023]
MSSIFTFDPDPPKALSSPWPVLPAERQKSGSQGQDEAVSVSETPLVQHLTDFAISSLEPEPQEGPTEYKLHLLLRPRRSFAALSTVQRVSGSHLSKSRLSRSESGSPSPSPLLKVSAAAASSNQSRQSRLQNLTTQLLWRLQQSSPHHPASRSDLVVPALPDVSERIDVPRMPGTLLPGLEDSQGALYEIGVADDGTIVGLTNDELDESLAVLRAMAFSLGCNVRLNRRIIAGDCQWLEDAGKSGKTAQKLRVEKLWVAEALISPDLPLDDHRDPAAGKAPKEEDNVLIKSPLTSMRTQIDKPKRDQFRVSLTGSTTSGKSSLLGTLSTSTLDNGRGKSRLSLLKHRHEIASGVTSSVTGSLIGYHDDDSPEGINVSRVHVVNYASGNVSSWTDIHYASDPGRLVFLNDSAGHPRFRRTTVRGLVSWAPHWTICCIAADSEEDTTGKAGATASASDILGSSCAEVDLATAHLELCLDLGLPLVVVITKLDLASLSALKPTLGKVLSALKFAGRRPEILSCPSDEQSFLTQSINRSDELEIIKLLSAVPEADICSIVPIVLTSTITGKGMDKVHALLRHLPIPKLYSPLNDSVGSKNELITPSTLFHIDEIFAANSASLSAQQGIIETSIDSILSGYLQRGALFVGQEVVIGPFSTSFPQTDSITHEVHRANSYPRIKGWPKVNNPRRILPRPLSGDFSPTSQSNQIPTQCRYVWRKVRVCSIRNLRLPVHELSSDQVGTVGLCPPGFTADTGSAPLASEDRIRKGMVLMSIPDQSAIDLLQPYNGFVALFEATESSAFHPGSSVIAYMASIRAPAKVLQSRNLQDDSAFAEGVFDFEDGNSENGQTPVSTTAMGKTQQTVITFQFLTSQEWFELGIQVLVMPASGFGISNPGSERGDKSSAGLDGLVGMIVQGLA